MRFFRWNFNIKLSKIKRQYAEKWKDMCTGACIVVSSSATPGTAARQAPLSMGFSRQEYWTGLPRPTPRESSHPRD